MGLILGSHMAMTMAFTFDSLKLADRLKSAGLPDEQARAIVEVVRESREATLAEQTNIAQSASERAASEMDSKTELAVLKLEHAIGLVRKDMTAMESGLRKDMAAMESGLRKDMAAMQNKILLKVGAMLVAAVGILLAVLPLLINR